MSNTSPYFSQTRMGESRWWSWLLGTWFTIVVGFSLGFVTSIPMIFVLFAQNPEAMQAFFEISQASESALPETIKLMRTLCGLAALFGMITWFIHRVTQGNTRQIFAWISGAFIAASVILGVYVYPSVNDPEVNNALQSLIGLSAVGYALMLMSFPAFLVGLFLSQKFIHRRTILSLHTAARRFNWMRVIFAILVTWGVYALFSTVLHVSGISPLTLTFDPSRFFTFALVTLLFIPLQSGTEEILFRGYFNQAFGHFISNKWIVFIITSVMFAALHLSNPEALSGAEKGGLTHLLVMSQYFLFGFILSVIVYFEDGLEAAIGVHAGNNMFAAMFVNYEGSVLPTPSLFLTTPHPKTDAINVIVMLSLITWLLYKTRRKPA